MATITIEMVDQIMERLDYVSYKEAREALKRTNGDVLDAIVLLEEGDLGFEKNFTIETKRIREQLLELFKKTNKVRVVVEKDGRMIINMPITLGAIGVAAMPVFTILGLSAAMLTNYSVKISDENSDSEVEFGILTPEKTELLKEILLSSIEDIKATFSKEEKTQIKEDDSDITEDLIRECESEED